MKNKLRTSFRADGRMILDYALLGDAITFDTTYTNKEYRPLGVFVGFNHHIEATIFGSTLMYDETISLFEWLFKTFLKAHKQKMPLSAFTAAMATTLSCYARNLSWFVRFAYHDGHLGNTFKEGGGLFKHFKQCMFNYEEVEEFEEAWKQMLVTHEFEDTSWLVSTYKVKEKWAKAYMKNAITLGMRSTHLSESLNADLKVYLKSDLDIAQFFKHFERVVSKKRHKELEAEFHSRQKQPYLILKRCLILQQALSVYTPKIYEEFVDQFDISQGASISQSIADGNIYEYIVSDGAFRHTISSMPSESSYSCSCKKFETFGILYGHIEYYPYQILTIFQSNIS